MHELLSRMLAIEGRPNFGGITNYGQSFSHAIARMADAETLRILAQAKPHSLSAEVVLQDASGRTSVEYLEERLSSLEAGEVTDLKEAFEALISLFEDGPHTSAQNGGYEDISITKKLGITLKIAELADGDIDLGEYFHDALESF